MAINKNHEFEELGGVKCAIAERNATKARVAFLKELLEHNGFTVVVVPSPPPKAPPPPPLAEGEAIPVIETTPVPELFTVGVTHVSFNPTNAIFGRMLHTKNGHVVTPAYWKQKETVSHDETPYYEQKL